MEGNLHFKVSVPAITDTVIYQSTYWALVFRDPAMSSALDPAMSSALDVSHEQVT